jgi:hypothetical protein
MRTISSTLTAVLLMATIENAASKPPTVVYPTGIFPTDVQNVQAAINQGGTVLLKATDSVGNPLAFNFGPATVHPAPVGFVLIQNDVLIVGEMTPGGRTTIGGGSRPFRIGGGKNSITGIKFDGPLENAISIGVSTGTTVSGNEIDNVVPRLLGINITEADGIDVFGGNPADISGNLVVSGNTFGDLGGDFSFAVNLDTVAANVTISNNTFLLGQSVSDLGFFGSSAIGCTRCHSVVTICGNMITIGPGVVFSGMSIDGDADARYHISGNTINSQGPLTDGIDIIGVTGGTGPVVAAVIEHNAITVHNSANLFAGIDLIGAVSQSTIEGNTVTGDTGVALSGFSFFPGDQIDQTISNRFLNNDIASVTVPPGFPLVFFDTTTVNNILRGQCVTVVDLGVGNDISCPNPNSHAALFSNTAHLQHLQHALQSQAAVHEGNAANSP